MKPQRLVAKWEVKGSKQYLALIEQDGDYFYHSLTSGGYFGKLPNDEIAIKRMVAPWGINTGPVTVMKTNYPSLKRVQ